MDANRTQIDRLLEAYGDAIDEHEKTESSGLVNEDNNRGSYLKANSTERDWTRVIKELVTFGIFFFVSYAATTVLFSYLPLYYKQLGFNVQEIGVLMSIQSWVAIPFTPFVGYIADRFTIRRLLLCGSLLAAAISHFALYFVPNASDTDCASLALCTNQSMKEQEIVSQAFVITDEPQASSIVSKSDEQYTPPLTKGAVMCHQNETSTGYLYNNGDLRTVFIYLVLVNIVCQLVSAPWCPLSTRVVLEALGVERRDQYAYFRGISGVGIALGNLLGGLMLDMTKFHFNHCGIEDNHTNFLVCFASFTVLMVVATPVAWLMSANECSERESARTKRYEFKKVIRALWTLRFGSVVLVITWLAITTGKMRTYDFWYMQTLGGSYVLMAWGGFIGQISMIVGNFCLPVLNKKFGHVPFLVMACLATSAGCAISASIRNAEWMLIPVLLREVTIAIYQQSSGAFLANAVDPQHQATLQSIMAAITFGIGKGVGSLLGGGLMQGLSPAMSYNIFAIVSFIMGLFLLLTQAAHSSQLRK